MGICKERAEKFRSFVEGIQGPVSVLFTQPDLDSIGSAFAMLELIRHLRDGESNVKVFYGGSIGHPQNRKLCSKFGLFDRMHHASKMKDQDFKNLILLDSSKAEDGRCFSGRKLDPIIVIDHHRDSDFQECEGKFVQIEDVGATCTLVLELLEGVGYKFENVSQFALMLAVGIHTDTGGLVSCIERDVLAYGRLMPFVDKQDQMAVFNYPLGQADYGCMQSALEKSEHRGASLVTNVGVIHSKDGDNLSTIADYLIRKEGVSLVIVWGLIIDTKSVRISARSTDTSLDLGGFLREAFGPSSGGKCMPDGKSSGGGMINLELGYWMIHDTELEALALVKKRIESAVFRK